ncbi:hypothetical protein SF83666_c32240 [Sinorhizobium fredii CCBAU 83666]|nr:hypothetical protein SF83666_c32240 [Sinorhizobium fredii CCBAU 83666]
MFLRPWPAVCEKSHLPMRNHGASVTDKVNAKQGPAAVGGDVAFP